MAPFIQDITSEVSDNWPAFLYILVMTAFSLRFLSERRAEARILKSLGNELHATIHTRFDHLEDLFRNSNRTEPVAGVPNRQATNPFTTAARSGKPPLRAVPGHDARRDNHHGSCNHEYH